MSVIYLAARYGRREELCGYREQLRALGHIVTSRWLDGAHQIYQGQPLGRDYERAVEEGHAETVPLRGHFAAEDLADVMAADTLVSFTERPRAEASRGGRHVEYGIALALALRVIVVGHRENVFHCLPAVEFHATWEAALDALATTQ